MASNKSFWLTACRPAFTAIIAASFTIFARSDPTAPEVRDSSYGGGGNDEREQTLNQLLSEMDGFDTSKGLVILAATSTKSEPDKEKNGTFASPATAFASNVFPVPGGPTSNAPFGSYVKTYYTGIINDSELVARLNAAGVDYTAKIPDTGYTILEFFK